MYRSRRKLYSQNFLVNLKLVKKLVGESSITRNDLVIEIGPGSGAITDCLLNQAQQVISVELDSKLVNFLRKRFSQRSNLIVRHGDILNFALPALPYKVFANIPFYIEGQIVRSLINHDNPPQDCYLVVRKEFGYRLAAVNGENMFSVMHKPWFTFEIMHKFSKYDFRPSSKVQAVLFRFKQRSAPLLPKSQKTAYQEFIKIGYGDGAPVGTNLGHKFNKNKLRKVLRQMKIDTSAKPSHLSVINWIELYIRLTS